jgi:hypothetical protein
MFLSRQIGDGPRHLENARVAAGRQPQVVPGSSRDTALNSTD